MGAVITSIIESGTQATRVAVECHLSNGLPNITIVGMGNKAVDESRERIRSAFAEAQLELPKKRITLNLAPADIPKDGTAYDLPIAAAILAASGQIAAENLASTLIIGEVGLDGSIRPVRGIIGKLLAGQRLGLTTCYIPADNLAQANLIPGLTLVPVANLKDFYLDVSAAVKLPRVSSGTNTANKSAQTDGDFKDVIGQTRAKRALEIAAAGGHNILLNGPPGTGKSMLAKALPSILPPMTIEETLATTHLHSLASFRFDKIMSTRPFRSPHHSSSEVAIVGGGQSPRPGEISLAHCGVLFFDELPEYSRSTLESLRQPLEDKEITVSRAKDTIVYPANFMFVATSNPCPCGYYGSSRNCTCTPTELLRYQRRLSGPILDRIDLYVEVDEVKHASLLASQSAEPSSAIKSRVLAARALQTKRFGNSNTHNAELTNNQIKKLAHLEPAAKELLDTAAERLKISARSYMKIVKVARTIADLNNNQAIGMAEITEALQYRRPTPS